MVLFFHMAISICVPFIMPVNRMYNRVEVQKPHPPMQV